MKRFRFSLETVLKVRRQAEEMRQRELAAAQAKRDHLMLRLGRQEHDLQQLLAAQSAAQAGSLDLNLTRLYTDRRTALATTIATLKWHLAQAETELEAARQKAVEAARERRVLEKLEETQRNAWLKDLNTEEQGFMDELAQRALPSFTLPSTSAGPA